jgi:hypothetical protein
VPVRIRNLTIRKIKTTKIQTAEMEFLRSVAGYTSKAQIRNTKIGDELNILI